MVAHEGRGGSVAVGYMQGVLLEPRITEAQVRQAVFPDHVCGVSLVCTSALTHINSVRGRSHPA